MSLRRRVLLLLSAVFLLYVVLLGVIVRFLVLPVLHQGEQELARVDINRVSSILTSEMEELSGLAREVFLREELADVERGIEEGLVSLALDGFQVDFAGLLAGGGELLEIRFPSERLEFRREAMQDIGMVVFQSSASSGVHQTPHGQLILGGYTDPTSGRRLVFGRFLDAEYRGELVSRISVMFRLHALEDWQPFDGRLKIPNRVNTPFRSHRISGGAIPEDVLRFMTASEEYPKEFFRSPNQAGVLKIITYFPGPAGGIDWVLEADRNRVFMTRIARSAFLLMTSLVGLGFILMLLILAFVSRLIIAPLCILRDQLTAVEGSRALPRKINKRMAGELGMLAGEFNRMLARLEKDDSARRKAEAELRHSEENYRNLAIHDDLTGLYNQRYMYQALKDAFARCEGDPISLIFIDIDKFKSVVDTHGHLHGSKAIAEVAMTIRECLDDDDSFAVSYGGDEYVVVLPGYAKDRGIEKAEQIRQQMARTEFLKSEGLNIKLTASFGVANFPEDADNMTSLLALADKALFYIKSRGKNGVGESRGRISADSVPVQGKDGNEAT